MGGLKPTPIRESAFADQIEHLLELFGWTWTHFEPAIRQSGRWATPLRGDKGLPDYIAVRDGRLLFIEIKGTGGRPTMAQIAWLEQLRNAGAETFLWWPDDILIAKEILR